MAVNMGDNFEDELIEMKRMLAKTVAMFKLTHGRWIVKAKETLLKNENRSKTYEICNGNNSPRDIAEKLGIDEAEVLHHLSFLLELGLIFRENQNGKSIYFKTVD